MCQWEPQLAGNKIINPLALASVTVFCGLIGKGLGSHNSTAPPLRNESTATLLRNLVQQQWICTSRRNKGQERFLGKGTSSPSSVQSQSIVNSTAASTGNTKTVKVKTNFGKVLDVKPGSSHGVRTTGPQESHSSPTKPVKTFKAQSQAQADTVQGHAFNYTASSCKSLKSCSQEAPLADRTHPLKSAMNKHRERQPQIVVAFKDLPLSQRYLASMPNKEFLPHPNHT